MAKKLPLATLLRAATDGPTFVRQLPDGMGVVGVLAQRDPLCRHEEWIELGYPLVVIRYALGVKGDLYGVSYCATDLLPHRGIAARIVTPNNCLGIEFGLVTEAGDAWWDAHVTREGDPAAAREYCRRVTDRDQPIYYWDHLLTMERAARYLDPDGRPVRKPQLQVGNSDKSPASVIGKAGDPDIGRLIDDGGIVADGDGEHE